jgi:hypothetical protein
MAVTRGAKKPAAPAARQPATAPRGRSWVVYVLLAGILLLGAALRVSNLDVTVRSPDERIYAGQARAALDSGVEGNRRIVSAFRANPQLWQYPPPSRIGYAYAVAAFMKITGNPTEAAGSDLSCLASILMLAVAAWLGLRFLGDWATVFGVLFLAVFPPELVVARRCWTDAPVALAGVAMLYLALEIWSGNRNRWIALLLALVGSAAAMVKETTVMIYAPCLAVALWAALRRARDLRYAAVVAVAAALCGAAAIAILGVCTGGIAMPFRIVLDQIGHNSANAYALEFASGPGYLLFVAFERLSPLTSVLSLEAAALLVAAFWIRRLDWVRGAPRDYSAALVLAWLTVLITVPYALVPHWLNLRYASASFAPLCLLAGAGIWLLFVLLRRLVAGEALRWAAIGGAAIAVILCVSDYQRFEANFVRIPTVDLSVKMVFDALEIPTE